MAEKQQTREEYRKKHLLAILKKINSLDDNALKIMQERQINGLRVIKRDSDSTRDNNPISSTMNCMSLKYPISVLRSKALEHGIPKEFLGQDEVRVYDRILCKREAIEWWIKNSKNLTPEQKNLVDLLMAGQVATIRRYLNVDWSKTRVRFGNVEFMRQRVNTNEPIFECPSNLINDVVISTLMPDYVDHRSQVPAHYLETAKEYSKAALCDTMTLTQQASILQKSLDPKRRMIPTTPSAPATIGLTSYQQFQPFFEVLNVNIAPNTGAQELERTLGILGQILFHLFKLNPAYTKLGEYLAKDVEIYGDTILNCLNACPFITNPFAKVVQCMMGQKISMNSKLMGVEFMPHGNLRPIYKKNISKFEMKIYRGKEVVYFIKDLISGSFEHDGPVITNITMSTSIKEEIVSLLERIGVYVRWQFSETKGRSRIEVNKEICVKVKEEPWRLVGVGPADWLKADFMDQGTIGCLHYGQEHSVSRPAPQAAHVTSEAIVSEKNQRIPLKLTYPLPSLPKSVSTRQLGLIDDYMWPEERVRRKFYYYRERFDKLKGKIKDGVFDWQNHRMMLDFAPEHRAAVSTMARSILTDLKHKGFQADWQLVCFHYIFSNTSLTTLDKVQDKILWNNSFYYDFEYNSSSLLQKVQGKNEVKYRLLGKDIGTSMKEYKTDNAFSNMVKGFKVAKDQSVKAPAYSLRAIARKEVPAKYDTISTIIAGRRTVLVRDNYLHHAIGETINTRLELAQKYDNPVPITSTSLKRRMEEDADDHFLRTKKRKEEEEYYLKIYRDIAYGDKK